MPLIVFHTKRVRQALRAPAGWGIELIFLGLVAAVVGGVVMAAREASAPLQQKVVISLSYWALPGYTLLSLCRGVAAYLLSLVFTLAYGSIAAHHRRAEKIMIPALDVLQSIPVLGFLPGVVLAMVHLFPTREMGLEVACIVMIFTAQVWNMTFSFHGSLRSIPQALREAARLQGLSGWQIFRLLEVPSAMIGLVWNSMMSMAGGWFFLTVNEAFTLGDRDFRLPGIGSYMSEAISRDDVHAMIGAVVAMVTMILVVDQVLWRPIVVWSQRFKVEEQTDGMAARSWILELLTRSRLRRWVVGVLSRRRARLPAFIPRRRAAAGRLEMGRAVAAAARWVLLLGLGVVSVWGLWSLLRLLTALPLRAGDEADWLHVILALGASFLRTTAAILIGAAWALPVGIWIGRSPVWSRRLQPVVQVVASFPAPMIFPLVTAGLLALHIPFTMGCVVLMLLGAQWYILFNVIAGTMAVPADLKEVATLYRVQGRARWLRLDVSAVFPYLVTGLITAAGGAWNATIVSEYVQVPGKPTYLAFGLGSLISEATTKANYPLLAAGVVTMAVSVVLINRVCWKRLYRLAEERFSLNA